MLTCGKLEGMNGVVQSGGTASLHIVAEDNQNIVPIANATVTLYESTGGTPVVVGQPTTTDANGRFSISTSKTSTSGIFYATADVGGGVVLMAIVGRDLLESITINELTTISACHCAAQFIVKSGIHGDSFALRIAAGMNANIVDVVGGTSSPVLESSPNGTETIALATTRSLANFLASCVRFPREFSTVAQLGGIPANAPGGDDTTITALGNIARTPARNVGGIFLQSKMVPCYQPPLENQPDAWTIVVKVNDSGDDTNMFGGPGNLAFDSRGRAWIGNNVIQGKPDSSPVSIVLDAAGHPALNDSGQRMSPFSGGGLLGAGFGTVIDKQNRVWIGDFGWTSDTLPPGSVSLFDSNANPLSPSEGYTAGVNRVQGMAFDGAGNLWMASWGNGCVTVYPNAANADSISGQSYSYPNPPDSEFKPFGIAIASDGTAWITDSNSASSGILHLRFTGQGFEKLFEMRIGKVLKGIVIDSEGYLWVASGGDDHVYRFDRNGYLMGGYQGGGVYGPWGICLDGDDNVWVANFGPLEIGSVVHGRLTQLAGVNAAGHLIGDGLSPQTGYTLPTGGSPVTLHDGTPLYGADGPPCFIPMMRTTGLAVDAAGNVWTCNNWKPDFDIDVGNPVTGKPGNPGGDGMLIWVGIAKPMTY